MGVMDLTMQEFFTVQPFQGWFVWGFIIRGFHPRLSKFHPFRIKTLYIQAQVNNSKFTFVWDFTIRRAAWIYYL